MTPDEAELPEPEIDPKTGVPYCSEACQPETPKGDSDG